MNPNNVARYPCPQCKRTSFVRLPDVEAVAWGAMIRLVCGYCDFADQVADCRARAVPDLPHQAAVVGKPKPNA